MSNFNTALTAVHSMSRSELDLLVEAIGLRRTALARASVRSLTVGDSVKFTGRGGDVIRGQIIKLNRKTAVVDAGNAAGNWRVTASLLTKA